MRQSPHLFDEAKARAVAWLSAWDSQGVHRTGSTGDEAGARWLAHEAAGLGVEVASEVFALDRLDPLDCYLELDGERFSGVPVLDAPATGANGLAGALTLSGHRTAFSSPSCRRDRFIRGNTRSCVVAPSIGRW